VLRGERGLRNRRRRRRAEMRMGRGIKGYPPPQPTRGFGEHRKLPQRGPGRSPGRKQILVHFELEKKNESGDDKFDIVCHFIAHAIFTVKLTRLALIFFRLGGGG